MGQINGIDLPAEIVDGLGGTPEEAAQVFMRAASQGLARVVADALVDAVGEAVGGGAPADWTTLIEGCSLRCDWGSPPGSIPQTTIAFSSPDAAPALGGGSISVSISATF